MISNIDLDKRSIKKRIAGKGSKKSIYTMTLISDVLNLDEVKIVAQRLNREYSSTRGHPAFDRLMLIGVELFCRSKKISTYTGIADELMDNSVLIAFVAISLIVSSIMIAIITYISVIERTKEIGILRTIGASKKDISRVFNAETLIEGLAAGVLGIVITLLLNIPINIIIKHAVNISNIALLPVNGAIILIIISVLLTVIAGFIPAKIASKKDPVEALRSE